MERKRAYIGVGHWAWIIAFWARKGFSHDGGVVKAYPGVLRLTWDEKGSSSRTLQYRCQHRHLAAWRSQKNSIFWYESKALPYTLNTSQPSLIRLNLLCVCLPLRECDTVLNSQNRASSTRLITSFDTCISSITHFSKVPKPEP